MIRKTFYLSWVIIFCFLILGFEKFFSNALLVQVLNYLTLTLCVLELFVFERGIRLRNHSNPYMFTRFFMLTVFLKMAIFVIGIILAVVKLKVEKQSLIMPALGMYVLVTIHETYFLMMISKPIKEG